MKRAAPPSASQARPRALQRALSAYRAAARSGDAAGSLEAYRDTLASAALAEARAPAGPDASLLVSAVTAVLSGEKPVPPPAEDEVVDVDAEPPFVPRFMTGLVKALSDNGTDMELLMRIDALYDQEVGSGGEKSLGGGVAVCSTGGAEESRPRTSVPETFLLNRTRGSRESWSYTLRDVVLERRPSLLVIMNFKIDVHWLKRAAPSLFVADRIVIVHGMDPSEFNREVLESAFDAATCARISVVRPNTPPYGTVHAKAVLAFCGDAGCRVMVHTANDIEMDWEQRAQGAWRRDFPSKEVFVDLDAADVQTSARVDALGDDFENALVEYFEAASRGLSGSVLGDVIKEVRKYDFRHAGAALVTSVPGAHGKDKDPRGAHVARFRHGHARLRKLLEAESMEEGDDASVVVQFSSIGSIRPAWLLDEFHQCVFSSKHRLGTRERVRPSDKLELILPTMKQVAHSNESFAAGMSIPVMANNIHRDHIEERLHVWGGEASGRGRAMPHIKTMLRYRRSNRHEIQWIMLGSANLSGAAWGWNRGGVTKPHIKILSFEIGVLLTPSSYCPPMFSLSQSIPKSIATDVLSEEKYQFHVCSEYALPSDASASKKPGVRHGLDPTVAEKASVKVVQLPIPYRLPPTKYTRDDLPWHVDPGSRGCNRRCFAFLGSLRTEGL